MSAPRPLPVIDPDSAPYWAAAATGIRLIQECSNCGHRQFYPRTLCVRCLGPVGWIPSTGTGRVYAYTVVHRAPAGFTDLVPYVVVLVDLDDGPRVMGRVAGGDTQSISTGTRVRSDFEPVSPELAIPVFVLEASA